MAKKPLKWLAVASVFALGVSSLFAQDTKALIDVLIQKGILSPAEARQIQTEAKQAEAKNMTKVSGKLYVDISSISAKNAAGQTMDPSGAGLDVKRFYLDVYHQFDSVWSADIKTDASYSSATGTVAPFLKTAFIQAKLSPAFIVRAGSSDMPWIPFDEGVYGYRYVENTLIDRLHFGNSADWGLHVFGKSGMVSYNLALVNGGGYKHPGRSKGMDVEGRLSIKPVKGLTLAVGGYNGKLGKDTYASSSTNTASRIDLLGAYKAGGAKIGVEYFEEDNWGYTASTMSDKADGYSLTGSFGLSGPFTLFGRYDDVKPSKKLHPEMKNEYFNLGVQYAVMKGLDVALVYKHDKVSNPSSANQTTKYDEIGLFAQAAF